MSKRALIRLTMAVALVAACGDDDGVVEDDGTGADLGPSTGDGGSTPSDSGTPGTDGGDTPMDDGGTTPPADSGTPSGDDAGTAGTIDCMGMSCDAATQQCCVTGGASGASAMCIPAGDPCSGGTADCDGPEDCTGAEVCCARQSGGSASASCTTDACGGGFTSFELCHEATDCSNGTDMCCPIMMFGISGGFCAPACGFTP